ncbi:PREDICTED: thyroid adenoma-associated protein homolog isoform X1 [Rhagoletis zephyria]|uniref:thyroid adenoma-associated protein homolog isoform X1 n=1 Tax=Rhagoletis zephyria TaxID=28612 RepID=UPI0008113799|nr:PREDICTED: thyroid adenoma-associated protein homolog isoform X1 [Rhagoletis zephyria]
MNSLNLRVSSVKTGENVKKNADMRTALVTLPKHYENSEASYCLELKNAKSIPEQVAAVKNIFKNLSRDSQALQFLADLYFHCPLKHPVRNQILKLLITAARLGTGDTDESSIVNALSQTIQRLVEEARAETESSAWNFTVTSMTGCFENFECGLKAIEMSTSQVFPFLCAAVQKYLTELGVLSSPSVRNEYYLYVHNAVRLLLSCIQEYGSKLKDIHSDTLKQLSVLCKQVVQDDEIPMDPRTNAGILLAHNARLNATYDTFIQEVKLTKNPNEIALCVGIVNTFDQHDFQRISADIRDICSKIDEIANANATVPNILLCATRALYQISKIILSFELKAQSPPTDDAKLILRKLLIYTFGFLEHHMDSVRHLCRDLLRNTVAAAYKIKFDFLIQKIYDACNSERLSLSMKCIVLQQTAAILGADAIIRNCPEVFTNIFAEQLGRDFMVNNLFETLMYASHKEVNFETWVKLWIEYMLVIATSNDARLSDIETLIVKAVKCEPKIVQHIIQHTDTEIPISTKLSALWAVRKAGIKVEDFTEVMEKFSSNLVHSILSNSDDTRIMALRLLVETNKTTELLTLLECENLLNYLEYNANCQSPATRQKMLGLFNKALIRCELNLVKVLKDYKSAKAVGAASNAGDRIGGSAPLQLKFLRDVIKKLVGNLFQGANFSRRSVSLQLLEQCIQICSNCTISLDDILPQNTVKALAEMLADSYEANKELAVNILKAIEKRLDCNLIKQHQLNISLTHICNLLTSVRPTDSVTGAYQLEFFCNRTEHIGSFGSYEPTNYNAIYYAALRWLLQELKAGLKVAKESLLQAAKLNPLYGILFTVKHFLMRLDFKTLAQEIPWRIVIAELIVLCKELTTVVAPVVNSSSPEGHLPNDFSKLPPEYGEELIVDEKDGANCKILSSKLAKIDLSNIKTTPQMVLLCAWRTVKEVSLILGEIVLRSPLQLSKLTEQFLITKEQLLEIGEHFKQLLAETKHRGAFEQAYVGFSKLCCRLWRLEVLDLNSLPMQWLRDLLTLISKDEQLNEKICATRRSAGVPFMVQALITSELQVGSTKSLYYCMSHLLQLCASRERSAESRTHAMNILRALFRCTDLNEAVVEYVCDGVMCAIRGYDAETWSEKNSATLLFSALITRIFGVQRTRDSDNLNVRNKMTGRVFFLRYPKLYDFFLAQLHEASELVQKQKKAHKLHPLLLILSRLYPSALEGTESNLKLTEFIPYISSCASCPEMQTRYLAAKAVLALVSKDAIPVTILRMCAEIVISADQPKSLNLNVLHGQLLQIYMLLKAHKQPDVELVGDIATTLVLFQEKTQVKNAILLKLIMDIFIEILQSQSNLNYPQETIQSLLYFTTQKEFYNPELSFYYPVLRKSFYIYNLHTLRLTLPFGALSDYLLCPPLTHNTMQFEQTEVCLNIILLLLRNVEMDVSEFEISNDELRFVRALPTAMRDNLATELRQSKALHATLKELIQKTLYYPECVMKAYAIMSYLDHFDFALSQLLKESKKHPGDVKSPLTMCVERVVLKQGGVDSKVSQSCLEYLLEISQAWNPDCLRLKAAQILSHIAVHFNKALEKKKLPFLRLYIGLTLALLMDDDFEIRDYTAKIVLNNITEDLGMSMTSVVATMAQRLFLQSTADKLEAMRADDNYILDIFKIINEALSLGIGADEDSSGSMNGSNSSSSTTGDLEIFDKHEANVFAEPQKAMLDAIVVFKTSFKTRPKILSYLEEAKPF